MKTKIFYTLVFFISIMFLLVGCQYEHTHSFSEEWSSDANSHWHAATCEHSSEVNEKADHTWDSGEITLEPTEQTDGKKTFICTVCQYTKEEKIDKLSHEHTWIDADCDNPKTCSKCNATEGEALGHTPKEAVKENEVAATCKAAGSYDEVVYCSVCEEEISRTAKTLEKLDHTEAAAVKENEVAATCKAVGSYDLVVYCSVCEEEISRTAKTLEKLDHMEAAAVKENEVAATCKAAGSYDLVVYCSVCEEEISRETKILDILEHTSENLVKENEVAATCDKDGKEAHYKCSGCSKLFQLFEEEYVEVTELDLVIPALEHSYGQLIEEVAATCDKDGKEAHYKCKGCDKLFQLVEEEYKEVTELDLVISSLGHSYGDLIEEVAATCDKDGKESHYKCSECSKLFQLVEEEYIEVTELDLVIVTKGHSFELTSDENNHWQECSVCHGIKDEEAHKGGIATTTELAECEVCHEKYGELLEPEEKMITVYFQRNWDWANISIYVYTDDKTYLEAWPGKRMELVGSYDNLDLYAFTFDANNYKWFIINGRNDSWQTPGSDQTPDLKVADYLDYFATDCFYMLWDGEKSCNAVGHCEMQSSKLHIHDFSQGKSNAKKHWFECSCGLKQGENTHTWDEGVEHASTCTASGKFVYTCLDCGYEQSEELEMIPHNYGELITEMAATCDKDGKEAHYKCSGCSKLFQLVEEEYVEVTDEELVIPSGHSWIDATCENPKTCNVCEITDGDALGHAYGSVEYVWANDYSSCTATRVCANDKLHIETETVDAKHEHENATETENGYDRYVATFQNIAFETRTYENVIPAIGHTHEYGDLIEEVAATCDKDGKESHYKCSGCSKLFQLFEEEYVEVTELDLVISSLGHSYGDLIDEVAATCDKDGKESHYKCSECSKLFQLVEEEYIEVTELDLVIVTKGHSYELTSDENNHWKECSVCHGIKDEEAHKGGIATTTELAECEVCHEKYGELLEPEEKMITVYFQRNWDWANISIYVYTDDKNYLEAWPGKRMELVGTYDGQDLYAFTFDANEYESFIINGRNDSWQTPGPDQTPDLKVADYLDYFATDCFYMLWDSEKSCNAVGHCEMQSSKLHMHEVSSNWSSDDNGHWHACNTCSAQINYEKHSVKADSNDESVCEICGVTFEQKTDMVTVHFENNWNWTNVRIHIFNNNGSLTTWPGEAMTKVGVSGTGNAIYAYTFDANIYTGIVITGIKNDGSGSLDQTPDIVIAQYRDILSTQYFYMAWDNGNKVGTWALPEELKK